MRNARPLGNAPLLVLLTSAIASCGSEISRPAPSDAAAFAADASPAASDAAIDAPPDAPVDAGVPSVRRPFLVGSSLRTATAVRRDDWALALAPPESPPDATTARHLAAAWLADALDEHASVAAFARFTLHLLSVGAPPELVIASQRASLDEVRHARACFALAARYGAAPSGPAPLLVHDALGHASLADVAALAAAEGCVGETLGAVLAREQWAVAADPVARELLRAIAVDEARHAELAWRFVRWAILRGGAGVQRAVSHAAERAIAGARAIAPAAYPGLDRDAWRAHGRLTCEEARDVTAIALREVVEPCLARVLERAAPVAVVS